MDINYYRLTSYFLPFKETDDEYLEGTSFNMIYSNYLFDRKLRNMLSFIIEHIDKIINKDCKAIEMETSSLFSACEVVEKECIALLVVSDNTIINKSLISGRTDKDMKLYHQTRYEIIPKIIFDLLEK